jgi:hypothetical protein
MWLQKTYNCESVLDIDDIVSCHLLNLCFFQILFFSCVTFRFDAINVVNQFSICSNIMHPIGGSNPGPLD